MKILVRGARENNLKDIDVDFEEGITVVTGISGSGKSSLVFDTLYHEAKRRFLNVFSTRSANLNLLPAKVQSITGIGPAIAVGQNLLNRNPLSTLATASGLHPFLRILFTNFGERRCQICNAKIQVLNEDEIIGQLLYLNKHKSIMIFAPLINNVKGSHRTLLKHLSKNFSKSQIIVDGQIWNSNELEITKPHSIDLFITSLKERTKISEMRNSIKKIATLGIFALKVKYDDKVETFSQESVCCVCGNWLGDLKSSHFHTSCPYCSGNGCEKCNNSGLHPEAFTVNWNGLNILELLSKSIDELYNLFTSNIFSSSANRLREEIVKRLKALKEVGLGYLSLDRSSPTLSRGESQRVRIAVAISSRLEDMLYVLDEPTIGQHMADVANFIPTLRKLKGRVIFVEHDRMAALTADSVIDIGPNAGRNGGKVVFQGTLKELWKSNTITGRFFSLRERTKIPEYRDKPVEFFTIKKANLRNLKNIDVSIPLKRLTVMTGVSGSGKSTFVVDVLVANLLTNSFTGCEGIEGPKLKPVIVDQSPIGKNPRSNPATYTNLSNIVRDIFASETSLSQSHFSFNRPEGACLECNGKGAKEVAMRYLPSTWITCSSCSGERFKDEVLEAKISFGESKLSIADFYKLNVYEANELLENEERLDIKQRKDAKRILKAMIDVGLGYLPLGQPSTTLSGGEAQRVKLAKYLGRVSLTNKIIILDEPSTGLHTYDITGLLKVLDRLVRSGATIVVVEHNPDLIKAADWIIDLGPGAADKGGNIVFAGSPSDIEKDSNSITGEFLRQDGILKSVTTSQKRDYKSLNAISVKGARVHNLQNISIDFPKNSLIVVTGVSGSGKSSLVIDILETEARRRFLETLSLYERQSVKEGPEAPVDSVSGLGVTISIKPERTRYLLRNTVSVVTGLSSYLAVLFANVGKKYCSQCNSEMTRKEQWICQNCNISEPIAKSRYFSPTNYAAACNKCNGVGTLRKPAPEKLIIHPDKPICSGAMYSPGFFPFGFICKPFNGGYYILQALAKEYGFDPASTPWNGMTKEAQHAFLFGHPEPLEGVSIGRKGRETIFKQKYPGFYGWIRDWDVGGTYTETQICPDCFGGKLKPQYLSVKIQDYNIHELQEISIEELESILSQIIIPNSIPKIVHAGLQTALKRLRFLKQVGLGYIHLNRIFATLSAGEAQRVTLTGLLGSGLTSLTILLDEPTRGLHPSEVSSLLTTLEELRDEGNTVIVVEHDPIIIKAANSIVDIGPGPGIFGGKIIAKGSLQEIMKENTLTSQWISGEKSINCQRTRRKPQRWMKLKGAKAYNLKGDTLNIPLGVIVGICGVSGSGKSTLLIDTLGRALVPKKQTTSVAYEPIEPGQYDEIEGAPERTIIVDQSRRGINSPLNFLGLSKLFIKLYAESEDAIALGIDEKKLSERCSICLGRGQIYTDMGFLPSIRTPCDNCKSSGHIAEVWDIKIKGYSLPELYELTIEELYNLFKNNEAIAGKLKIAIDVGLGYLVLKQPGFSLSGGEAQRLKIALELSKKTSKNTLYILDEPTVGQHLEDINRLITVLDKIVQEGHTVVVIEHSPELLSSCDWLIELGPKGGSLGGKIIANGTPDEIALKATPTAPYLRKILRGIN